MHHIYPGGKGDPLCPLGFHPQVRWPTRCKRCFRDYKEHGGKGKDEVIGKEDMTKSTPSLSTWNSVPSRGRDDSKTSSTNAEVTPKNALFNSNKLSNSSSNKSISSSSSWTSTPDLGNLDDNISTTVSVTLPRRRRTSDLSNDIDSVNKTAEFTVKKGTYTTDLSQVLTENDSGDKDKALKSRNPENFGNKPKFKVSVESTPGSKSTGSKSVGEAKKGSNGKPSGKLKQPVANEANNEDHLNPDVEFILRVKSSKEIANKKTDNVVKRTPAALVPPRTAHISSSSSSSVRSEDSNEEEEDDFVSVADTETTETTLVGKNDSELLEEVESLRSELETLKARCERVEREKSDILLRRLASFDTASTKTAASEVLKLQKKLNELSTQSEDLKDDNKSLSLRVRELEKELEEQKRTSEAVRRAEELQTKLAAAETLCEELMDENEEMKKELRELEDEIEEMQDNFREDQVDEYSSLKKELEQTTKNCRILSFKLRKSERKAEQLEAEKLEAELKYKEISDRNGVNNMDKMKKLEGDLKAANEVATRLTKELEEANKRLKTYENKNDSIKSQPAAAGNVSKPAKGEKVSRASLIRGGSQEDPQQLLRDLQDSLERETDLREQLRFAEEEAANLRKKAARVEEDNDSLALQLKKMATKAKTARRNSPCTRTPRPVVEKEETVSDEDDPTELKVLLELNEQESAVLRKKVEELETDSELQKKQIKELEEKLASANSGKKLGGVGGLGVNAVLQDKEKIKVAEDEIALLRKKVIEKEKEIKRLENELESAQKRPRGQLMKSQSLDSPTEQKALDFKRQLELVEQEANILRTKISTLESDNEKLSAENKKLQLLRAAKKPVTSTDSAAEEKIRNLESKLAEYEKEMNDLREKLDRAETTEKKSVGKSSEVDKLKAELKAKTDELEKLTKENKSVQERLRRLKEDSANDLAEHYKNRKPKKPTDLTTKLQLKKMVEALENEIGDILVALQKSESEKSSIKMGMSREETEEKNKIISELEKKLKAQEKALVKENDPKEVERLEKEKRNLEADLRKIERERESWNEERKCLEARLNELTKGQNETSLLSKKLESANKQLDEEKANVKTLKKQTESIKKLEEEKAQLQKDVSETTTAMTSLKKKLTETEEKLEKSEKNLLASKTKISKLEKTLEELEEAKAKKEKNCKTLEDELAGMKENDSSLKAKIAELEAEIKKGKDIVKGLEESIRKEREKATDACLKAGSAEKKEITALREDLSKKMKQMDELNEKFEKMEKAKKMTDENLKVAEAERTSWKEKASELESELNFERKKFDQMKTSFEREIKTRDTELSTLKVRVKTLEQTSGASNKKMTELKTELSTKVQKLESELQAKKKNYEELTSKYELLEEEHVMTKAQLVMEKERAQSEMGMLKKEVARLEAFLKDSRESLTSKQEEWERERKELQEKVKGTTERVSRASEAKWELERSKLQAINEEQKSLAEQLKQQNEAMVEQMAHMRKENEELRKKLDDFDKVSKIQRQISADTNQLDMQLREVRGKLAAEEKNHKSEMAALKLRYESRVNLISEELQTSQNQLSRFKRERDTYKHLLEEAQLQMADLKKEEYRRNSFSDGESKDSKALVAALEQQVSCMEDELSEARLECSKVKTEFISEKSAWEVKLSELQSRINELEEEKILSSGRTKVAGLRTKMELSWQKEREDQQRLLQETSTLARDLRQTLYEVERERDKERLESKRRQEQIKRTSEEEMEENRKKITELQCDLLELRDAHAKLRTTNEKLRREKEKWEKESRMLQRLKIRNAEENRKISILLDNIDLLLKASFEKKNSGKFLDSSSKKRAKSKSRESSPMTTPQDENLSEIQLILQQLNEVAEDIRAKKQEEERDEDRSSRASSVGFRRAASTESDTVLDSSRIVRRPIQRKNTLHRKSLSLSETTGPEAQDQPIWREEGKGGSLTSLEERGGGVYKSIGLRENSMDSRLSGGSTQSEVIPGDRKKKKSFFGKLKKLAKSRSIEDPTSSQEDILRGGEGSDSDISTASDFKGSKKDLKEKIAGIFSKDSSSKTNTLEQLRKSEERKPKNLLRNSSGGSTAPPSLPPKSSTLGRPLDKARNPAASLLNKP